jgi:tRNA uridine 5-carboxymethylaminomethyl modification enzyme
MFQEEYDVIVVGAGHAGSEAAAAAKPRFKTFTMSLQNIAQMSCNPAKGIQRDK